MIEAFEPWIKAAAKTTSLTIPEGGGELAGGKLCCAASREVIDSDEFRDTDKRLQT